MQNNQPPDDLSIGKGLFSLGLVLIAGAQAGDVHAASLQSPHASCVDA
jgi:hypothetical protein